MKKITLIISILISMAILNGCKDGTQTKNRLNRCGTVEDLTEMMKKDPSIKVRSDKIEADIKEYFKRYNLLENHDESVRGGRLIIPVVVHVLYNNNVADATNVTDAKINEQIDRLNLDFRKLNTDASSVPAAFSSVASDSRIEFQLCKRDPSCNATTGITRTLVTATSYTAHDAKFAASGGVDAWNTSKYLNIWVIPALCVGGVCTGWLGEASFPSFPANQYGFVVQYNYLGNTTDPHYNLGRTAVHEFGHFFNLKHIWGDDCGQGNGTCTSPGECAGTDDVGDTPNQGEMNFNIPAFPHTDCCTSISPGVMFMNYMDYTDDAGMIMFSQGQVDRMIATLYTTMSGLLSSDALIPPPATASADLFIQDTPEDIGNEPNNESSDFYISEDIWIRNTNDGFTNMEHQNPVYRSSGPSNFVYVRIRNRGCQPSTSANVKLYWAKASTGLGWPDPWNGGIHSGTALMGDILGMNATGIVAGGSSTVLEFAWSPPNPADYSAFGGDQAHFCLLARIEPPTVTETSSLVDNVKNNNNIAWKNVEVVTTGGGRQATTLLENYSKENKNFSLGFSVPQKEESAFKYGNVYIKLSPKMFDNWKTNGGKGNNISIEQDNRIRLLNTAATIEGITLNYKEIVPVTLFFIDEKKHLGPHVYFIDVKQFSDNGTIKNFIGAQRIWIKTFNK